MTALDPLAPSGPAAPGPGSGPDAIRLAGEPASLPVPDDACTTLLTVLRDGGRTEVKEACGEGRCGACAVLVDGDLRLSCLTLAVRVAGASVTTAAAPACARAREAIVAAGAVQCGYCAPGVVVALAWAEAAGSPADEALAATICRCGCHPGFRQAAAALGLPTRAATPPGAGTGHRQQPEGGRG